MSGRYDVAVVGGGLVGLATARRLLLEGVRRVVVLEKEADIALHQSGRNSGVVHSGLYYRPGSLKAAVCTRGRERLYAFCEEKGVPVRRTGKIVVAHDDSERAALEGLRERGTANGLRDLRVLDRTELRELEPEVEAVAGLHVAETGVIDFGEVARTLARDVATLGGEVRTGARVAAARRGEGSVRTVTTAGEIESAAVITCAGLESDRAALLYGVRPGIRIVPFRGEYYELTPGARALVRNPIYPVPNPAFPFLGVHLTPTIDGRVEAGPNAVLAFAREGYRFRDVSPRDLLETLLWPGFWRLTARHLSFGLSEMRRSLSTRHFLAALRRLIPRLEASDLLPGRAGVRAQAVDRRGRLVDDFLIVEGERSLHVVNAPSPAATACLGIGEHVAGMLLAHSSWLDARSPRGGEVSR